MDLVRHIKELLSRPSKYVGKRGRRCAACKAQLLDDDPCPCGALFAQSETLPVPVVSRPAMKPIEGRLLCLACGRQFEEDLQYCPHDNLLLVSLGPTRLHKEFSRKVEQALNDQYSIKSMISHSKRANVYLAELVGDSTVQVAIKVTLPLHEYESRSAARREAKLLHGLPEHPNICRLVGSELEYKFGTVIIFEYVDGIPLSALIENRELSQEELIALILQVTDGLQVAHNSGVIHADLNPGNIIVTEPDSEHVVAVICGFSLERRARIHSQSTRVIETATTYLGYSPAYAAPEGGTGPLSDVYSLGCILYEGLTGQPPYSGATSVEIGVNHHVQPIPSLTKLKSPIPNASKFDPIIQLALAKKADDRFGSMIDFAAALRKLDLEC